MLAIVSEQTAVTFVRTAGDYFVENTIDINEITIYSRINEYRRNFCKFCGIIFLDFPVKIIVEKLFGEISRKLRFLGEEKFVSRTFSCRFWMKKFPKIKFPVER